MTIRQFQRSSGGGANGARDGSGYPAPAQPTSSRRLLSHPLALARGAEYPRLDRRHDQRSRCQGRTIGSRRVSRNIAWGPRCAGGKRLPKDVPHCRSV